MLCSERLTLLIFFPAWRETYPAGKPAEFPHLHKRASFVAKRPNYGRCVLHTSTAMRSGNGQHDDNNKQ
jgi:hypothetical protein